MFGYRHRHDFFLLVVFIVGATVSMAQKPGGRFLTEQIDTQNSYQILMATFGDQLQNLSSFNVMLPPDDRHLCNFPNLTTINSTKEEIAARIDSISHPIALLVPRSSPCSNQQRANILLEMQKEISSMLKLLIVYEEEPKYMGYFLLLKPDQEPAPEALSGVSLTYLPYLELRDLARRMEEFASGENLFFLHPGNEDWLFIHTVLGEWEPVGVDSDGRDARSDHYYGQDDYDWIRYTLFSLLLISPCLRAVYLFYAGGGRIHFRRNEAGIVTGFQYIPPMPYWLSHGRPPRPVTPSSETLTLAQFNDLPVIIYEAAPGEDEIVVKPGSELDDTSIKSDAACDTEIDVEMGGDIDKPQLSGSFAVMESEPKIGSSTVVAVDDIQFGSSRPQTEPTLTAISTMKTICTECSICIDDFEVGERLTLLPRCRHAFHSDCIKPWLLERQGCCPLCKMSVLEGDDNASHDSEQGTDNSSANAVEPASR